MSSQWAAKAVTIGTFSGLSIGTVQVAKAEDGVLYGFRTRNASLAVLDIDVVTGRDADGDRIIESQASDGEINGLPVLHRFPESCDIAQEIKAAIDTLTADVATVSAALSGGDLTAFNRIRNILGI